MTINTEKLKTDAAYWDGEGYPPVGCECEVEMQMADQSSGVYMDPWRWCEILAHRDNCAIVWVPSVNKALKVCNRAAFRPFHTAEQRQREELEYIMRGDDEFFIPDWIRLKVADRILSRYNLEPKK